MKNIIIGMLGVLSLLPAAAQAPLGHVNRMQSIGAGNTVNLNTRSSSDSSDQVHASQIGTAKTKEFFERIKESLILVKGRIFQNETGSNANSELIEFASEISQVIDEHRVLLGGEVCLYFDSTANLFEGTMVYTNAIFKGPYRFTSVMGARRKIKEYEVVKPEHVTFEQFLTALRDGKSFKGESSTVQRCRYCGGSGIVKEPGKMTTLCAGCSGKGKALAPTDCTLVW